MLNTTLRALLIIVVGGAGAVACATKPAVERARPAPIRDAPDPTAAPRLNDFIIEGQGINPQKLSCPPPTRGKTVFTPKALVLRCETVDGVARGPVFHFHRSGFAATAGTWAVGFKQVGTWRHWDEKGKLVRVEEFDEAGELIRSRTP